MPNDYQYEKGRAGEAVAATFGPQSLLGDLQDETTVGTRLRRELEFRYLTVCWTRELPQVTPSDLGRSYLKWWRSGRRDLLIGRSVLAALARHGSKSRPLTRKVSGTWLGEQLRGHHLHVIEFLAGAGVRPDLRRNSEEQMAASCEFDAVVKASFGDVLAALFSEGKLSVAQVSEQSGVDKSYIRLLIDGGAVPNLHVLFRLRRALRHGVAELISMTEARIESGPRQRVVPRFGSWPSNKDVTSVVESDRTCFEPSRQATSLANAAVMRAARLRVGGLSQERLARDALIDRTYLSVLERAHVVPGISAIIEIARQCGLRGATYISLVEALVQTDINAANANRLLEQQLRPTMALIPSTLRFASR